MTLKTRQDLIDDVLANLGIVIQTDSGATRTRAELVTTSLANLGIVYQTDASATRTRAEWVTETLSILGILQQTDAGTTFVRADLVNNVANILGPGALGQTLDAENYALIDARIPSVVADLNARIIATVSNLAAIPAAWFDSLSLIVANSLAGHYGVIGDEAVKLAAAAQLAEKKLRTLSRTGLVDEILPSLVGELNARGIATVTVGAIPGAWFASLADIAAEHCKGKFEVSTERSQEIAAKAKSAEVLLRGLTRGALVDAELPSIMSNLNARGVVTIANLAAIPGAYFQPLADIVAEEVRAKCDVTPEIAKRVTDNAARAERTLKNLTRSYIIERNIDPILADLAVRDIVALVDTDNIPDEWFVHIAAIVADRCKGKGFDLDAGTLARVSGEGRTAIAELRELTRGRPTYLPQTSSYF